MDDLLRRMIGGTQFPLLRRAAEFFFANKVLLTPLEIDVTLDVVRFVQIIPFGEAVLSGVWKVRARFSLFLRGLGQIPQRL